ncbi:MAG: hypothetical protein EBV48_04330, partial [Betaproteobacteria bacterium]|nr:hypothetical protein [Betaproteobacteria bacterium]
MTVAPIAAAALLAFASVSAAALAESAAPPLPPEQVFALDVQRTPTGDALHLGFNIRPGYYLYRDRISAKADSASVSLAPPQWPDGEVKHDPNFGEVRIFREQAVAILRNCLDEGFPPVPVVADSWFDSSELMQSLACLGLTFVCELKSKRWVRGSAAPRATKRRLPDFFV